MTSAKSVTVTVGSSEIFELKIIFFKQVDEIIVTKVRKMSTSFMSDPLCKTGTQTLE